MRFRNVALAAFEASAAKTSDQGIPQARSLV